MCPYNLPAYPKKGVRLLSLDPGSANMGIAMLELRKGKTKPRVLATTVLDKPVSDLINLHTSRSNFLKEVDYWVDTYSPSGIILERFQARMRGGGILIECVGVMAGLLAGAYKDLPIKFITASTWKNAFHREFDVELKDIYSDLKAEGIPPHSIDSVFIGMYGMRQGNKKVNIKYDPDTVIENIKNVYIPYTRTRREK